MTKEQVIQSLGEIGKDRRWLSEQSGYSEPTVMNKLGPKGTPSERMLEAFERAIKEASKEDEASVIRVPLSDDALEKAHQAAHIVSAEFQDFCSRAILHRAEELIKQHDTNITPLPQKKAHIMAAAGPGIAAEVIDWEGDDDMVSVKICGDSMEPLFKDGQVIDMRHKRASISPYMKKGLIYLVQLEGEWMVKRYDTRAARPDEKDADYLTETKRVGILKSENPAYDAIDITGSFEWAAWL